MRKMLSILLVAVLLLSLSATVLATGGGTSGPNLKVLNATYNKDYHYYQIFIADSYVSYGTTYVTYFTDAAHKDVILAMNDATVAAHDADCPFEVSTSAQPGKIGSEPGYAVTIKSGKTNEQIINWLQRETANSSDAATNKNFNALAISDGSMIVANGVASATVTSGYY